MNKQTMRRDTSPTSTAHTARAPAKEFKRFRFRQRAIVFCFVFVSLLFVICFLITCRVKTVLVECGTIVSEQEIRQIADIKEGRHLFAVDLQKMESEVKKTSPYIKHVSVKRVFPNSIKIHVEEYVGAYYVEFDNAFWILSDSLRVLEQTEVLEDRLTNGMHRISLPEIQEIVIGKEILLKEKAKLPVVRKILDAFSDIEFPLPILYIDMSSEFNITANVADRYHLVLGNSKDLDTKLSLCIDSMHHLTENMSGASGILYAAIAGEVSFKVMSSLPK